MRHTNLVSRHRGAPAKAESILAKGAQIGNVLSGVIALQEISDLLNKDDVHGN